MRHESYRYFLGTHPHGPLRQLLTGLQEAAGQRGARVRPEYLHLTFCTIAELATRDYFILSRVETALAGIRLISGSLRLGRMRGSSHGAVVHSRGPKPELLELYRVITTALAARGLPPLHRQSGLHPHFTLGIRSLRLRAVRCPLRMDTGGTVPDRERDRKRHSQCARALAAAAAFAGHAALQRPAIASAAEPGCRPPLGQPPHPRDPHRSFNHLPAHASPARIRRRSARRGCGGPRPSPRSPGRRRQSPPRHHARPSTGLHWR